MNIWLVNPFSDLPHEEATEGRFCCLSRMLVEQGHEVVWWSADFHHRTKRRRQAPSEGESEGESENFWQRAESSVPGAGTTPSLRATPPQQGGELEGMEIVLLPVSGYRKNISLARLRSHRAYGRAFAEAAAKRIAENPDFLPDVIHLSAPPLDCIEPALALKRRYGCRVTVDIMDLWPETFYRTLPKGLSFLGKCIFAPLHRKARRAYREADGVSAVSQEYLNLVAQIRSNRLSSQLHSPSAISSSPSSLHLCYVGGELINPAPNSQVSTLKSQPSKVAFIYVGAITPTYDLATILEAAALLKDREGAFEVVFAGSGVSEASLKEQAEALGLSDVVSFLGFLNQTELQEALGGGGCRPQYDHAGHLYYDAA